MNQSSKKENEAFLEIETIIDSASTNEEKLHALNLFERLSSDKNSFEFQKISLKLWPMALAVGKITIANQHAQRAVEYLIEYKRIPQLRTLLLKLKENGLLKTKINEYDSLLSVLEGKNKVLNSKDLKYIDLLCDHPEIWKSNPEFLKHYLILDGEWNQEQWKMCYEFILKNFFDKEVFISLYEKSKTYKSGKHSNAFEKYFSQMKLKLPRVRKEIKTLNEEKKNKFQLDYDQVAFELLSGNSDPNAEEQIRVISSLKYIPDEELRVKGSEMVVAFELLGMDQVVFSLCEKMVRLTEDPKTRASIYFMWSQALYNSEEYHKSIDLISEVMSKEPLINQELIAFSYLKAECCLKINNKKMAKDLFLQIKQLNPHYRLVKERLKALEEIK